MIHQKTKKYELDMERYAHLARVAAAESCVLLRNEKQALPIKKGENIAVFGRCAFHYYKSGLGSGGLVNTNYVVSILDALNDSKDYHVNQEVQTIYEDWIKTHPYDEGEGWGTTPWSQEEMPLTKEVMEVAKSSDVAVIVIGRTAGEDQDNKKEEGSYYLTKVERSMIEQVCQNFERSIVLLNVGNIIDMSWVEEYGPSAVMYVWQGGQEGGNGVFDVLTGAISPCGKLTDTIVKEIEDYPSDPYFGDPIKNYYTEDIYVGYRYFESCAKDRVQYPFGFGLSYTTFNLKGEVEEVTDFSFTVKVTVENTGEVSGKEVVQVYIKAPQGKLKKPHRVLVGFAKTKALKPKERETIQIQVPFSYFASYDDSGMTGHKSCYVLEEGNYEVYVGSDVRSAICCGDFLKGECVLEQLEEACAPIEKLERFVLEESENGCSIQKEEAPMRTIDIHEKVERYRETEIPYTGDQGFQLEDVVQNKCTLEQFIAQLTDEELVYLFRGEGMCSPKVTPGTAAAFGGLNDTLQKYGIPAACCADGPSGIRMDCGTIAFSLPNGTALGSTFNMELVEQLYQFLGMELLKNKVDILLGPGMNIHRHPLNGRNFEYISEDPIVTGKISVAQIRGLQYAGVEGTVKHYCANNQEANRTRVESVISERALREIYLKGFELVVKEGDGKSFMTTYGPVNGIWTAGNFDLCTSILRKEWKFEGIVMTDWWAMANHEGELADKENRAPMVLAQNDLYMCCSDVTKEQDNVMERLKTGYILRSDLQRNTKNILKFLMNTPAMKRIMGEEVEVICINEKSGSESQGTIGEIVTYTMDQETGNIVVEEEQLVTKTGKSIVFGIVVEEGKEYHMQIQMMTELGELAQLPLSIYMDNIYRTTLSMQGTSGKTIEQEHELGFLRGANHYIKLVVGDAGMKLKKIMISYKE